MRLGTLVVALLVTVAGYAADGDTYPSLVMSPATSPASGPAATPDAFDAMQRMAIQAKAILRPIPPISSNLTEFQTAQAQASREQRWRDMREKLVSLRDTLKGQRVIVSGSVEDVIANDSSFTVVVSQVAYIPPADMSKARSLAAAGKSRKQWEKKASSEGRWLDSVVSRGDMRRPSAREYSQAAAVARQNAIAAAQENGLHHTIALLTNDAKVGAWSKGTVSPQRVATIEEVHLYLAEGKEITSTWDGHGYWDKPLVVRCVAVADDDDN